MGPLATFRTRSKHEIGVRRRVVATIDLPKTKQTGSNFCTMMAKIQSGFTFCKSIAMVKSNTVK